MKILELSQSDPHATIGMFTVPPVSLMIPVEGEANVAPSQFFDCFTMTSITQYFGPGAAGGRGGAEIVTDASPTCCPLFVFVPTGHEPLLSTLKVTVLGGLRGFGCPEEGLDAYTG